MSTTATTSPLPVEMRAGQSLGTSSTAIYQMVTKALEQRHTGGGVLIDVGCGTGNLWQFVCSRFDRYVAVDALRYAALSADAESYQNELDTGRVPLPDHTADVVAAVGIIEHLENPRALVRVSDNLLLIARKPHG